MKNKKPYAPNERGHFDEKPKVIKAYSEKDYSLLPDNISDPIVVNNIATEEFDYIYDPEHDSED
ncbi:MAG TPA: hypothetical protein VIK72_09910 [Clostridiaceae bacterium]